MSVGLDRLDYFVVIAGCIVVAVVGIIKDYIHKKIQAVCYQQLFEKSPENSRTSLRQIFHRQGISLK